MSRILAIDTTSEFGSIALTDGGEVLEELLMHSPDGFGHVLYGHLERLLERHGVPAGEIDCFAAASGPGSFTGVRVGLSAVKGLAEAAGKPAVAVSNLQALACFGSFRLRAPVLDARRGEVYAAVYDAGLQVVSPEVVSQFPGWLASLPDEEIEFISTGFTPFASALMGTRFADATVTEAPRALAAAIASLAAESRSADPAALDANYVRRADAELKWRDPAA